MPILTAEPELFPDELFADPALPQTGRSWWALHTKPRQEKSLARQLRDAGVPFYLPLVERRTRIRGRAFVSHVPLFAGYLFLFAERDERLRALNTGRVVNSLTVANQEGLWNDLRQVQRLIATGAPITPEQRLAPGMTIEVRNGPLAGLKGKILRAASGRRFVIQVNFIQQGASVLLDDIDLAFSPE